jgi:tight adherence protein C
MNTVIMVWLTAVFFTIGTVYLKFRHRFHAPWIEQQYSILLRPFIIVAVVIVEILNIPGRLPDYSVRLQQRLMAVHYKSIGAEILLQFWSEIVSCMLGVHIFIMLLALSSSDGWMILLIGTAAVIIVPFMWIKRLYQRFDHRKELIRGDLPELMDKLSLLLSAGETLQRALERCAVQGDSSKPLYAELQRTVMEWKQNHSFTKGLEALHKRCGTQELSVFVNTMLIHYRKGGDEFVWKLRELSVHMWEKKKAAVQIKGEQASAKMVFPMMILFLVIMVIVASPAVLMMNE